MDQIWPDQGVARPTSCLGPPVPKRRTDLQSTPVQPLNNSPPAPLREPADHGVRQFIFARFGIDGIEFPQIESLPVSSAPSHFQFFNSP